ncbi:hypothetical protein OUZ56_014938 [Daphnia magna]|uniref:Uncharacterized protein n=1 Tax=Daphnia magna TaxID=35525 RepID=A0ABR0ALA5_9CRUS|nr:hypothetical protein OUZ56_014938 [Daphnia magna]
MVKDIITRFILKKVPNFCFELSDDWIYKFYSMGRESERCVNALHAFTNNITQHVTRDQREILRRFTMKYPDQIESCETQEYFCCHDLVTLPILITYI